jgi:ankyrin repeat protein
MLENDPFQHEAYMLPKSYEFINAVKFQNYDFVIEALNSNKNYLFSVDYLGETAYHWAAKLGDLKMMKILVDYGPYHNQKDYKGRTPLYLAVVNNHKDICSYLLNKGANIYLKDKNGLSPADVAKTRDMLSLLSEFMAQPFSNPVYKKTIKKLLIDRDKKIKIKDEQKEKEKMLKENEKKIKGNKNDENGENDEENQELNDDNEEKEKENENDNENNEN